MNCLVMSGMGWKPLVSLWNPSANPKVTCLFCTFRLTNSYETCEYETFRLTRTIEHRCANMTCWLTAIEWNLLVNRLPWFHCFGIRVVTNLCVDCCCHELQCHSPCLLMTVIFWRSSSYLILTLRRPCSLMNPKTVWHVSFFYKKF